MAEPGTPFKIRSMCLDMGCPIAMELPFNAGNIGGIPRPSNWWHAEQMVSYFSFPNVMSVSRENTFVCFAEACLGDVEDGVSGVCVICSATHCLNSASLTARTTMGMKQ